MLHKTLFITFFILFLFFGMYKLREIVLIVDSDTINIADQNIILNWNDITGYKRSKFSGVIIVVNGKEYMVSNHAFMFSSEIDEFEEEFKKRKICKVA